MPSQLIKVCSQLMKEHGLTIAFAESVTAGRLAAEFFVNGTFRLHPESGLVCYDEEVKKDVLGISPGLIEEFTPESEEVTKELALRLKTLIRSDIWVRITGLTTPGGSEVPQKPVGTISIHILTKSSSLVVRNTLEGSPEQLCY